MAVPLLVTSVPNSAELVLPMPPELSLAINGKLTSPGMVSVPVLSKFH